MAAEWNLPCFGHHFDAESYAGVDCSAERFWHLTCKFQDKLLPLAIVYIHQIFRTIRER